MLKLYTTLLILMIILLSGCSQKVQVYALHPAEVDRAAMTKKIAVSPFHNDRVGLSSKIESSISRKRIDGKHYFTTISRGDINKILKEQRLQNSGLLNESTLVQIGELVGAQALVNGSITTASSSDTRYYETRVKCSDKKCKNTYEYRVGCTKRVVTLAAQVKMVDIEKGDIIYADTLSNTNRYYHCSDDSNTLPSRQQGLNTLANRISINFVHKLAPYYKIYYVELLDEPEIDYTDKQEEMLEHALVYIEHKRYKKAEQLFSQLLQSTQEQCYVAAYNLGIIKEVQGDLDSAGQLYALSDNLTSEPTLALDKAILRIERSISAHNQASRQLEK